MALQQVPIAQGVMGVAGGQPHPDFQPFMEQLPDDWKTPVSNLLASAATMWVKLSSYNESIQHLDELEGLVKSATPALPEADKVKSIMEKLSNAKASFVQSVKSFCSADSQSCNTVDYEAIWNKAQAEVVEQVRLEKMEAANNCVRCQLITSAVILVVECQAIYATFADIQNAENVVKQCKDVDIPYIQTRILEIQEREGQLRSMIEQYLVNGTMELKFLLLARSAVLTGDLNEVRNLIVEVRFEINGQIVKIGAVKRDQVRRGFSNGAQALGNAFQLAYLFGNLSNPFRWIQGLIAASFGIVAILNVRNSFVCEKKLEELRQLQPTIRELELFVRRAHEAIQHAESLLNPNQPQIADPVRMRIQN